MRVHLNFIDNNWLVFEIKIQGRQMFTAQLHPGAFVNPDKGEILAGRYQCERVMSVHCF